MEDNDVLASNTEVEPKVRVTHTVLYIYTEEVYRETLQKACSEAEADGMMLAGIVPAGERTIVAIFVGAEDFLEEKNARG